MAHRDVQPKEKFALTTSRHFTSWLAERAAAIAFTTYQAQKVFLLGLGAGGRMSVFERTFARCMGLAVSGDARSLALATQCQLYRFDNVLDPGQTTPDGHDTVYAPHGAWITGDLDVHDVAFDGAMRPVFVNTLFSCLATVSEGSSFRPLWQPPFISKLSPEDRCHLNGLAMEAGAPRYVTAVARSDVADGWRDSRRDGGVVIDVASGEVVTPEEVAFYDALAENESAVEVMGSEQLRVIAHQLVEEMRASTTVDWHHKASARARMRILVKRILKRYGYPPDLEQEAVQTVLAQAEVMLREVTPTPSTRHGLV